VKILTLALRMLWLARRRPPARRPVSSIRLAPF
jgi:hypothetical protein